MKNRIPRLIFWWITLFCFSAVLWAQDGAGQAGAFLRYGIGGRALGMGRAFVGVADDASGVYWNPAGIVGTKRFELSSMYTNLYFDSEYAYFGLVIPRISDEVQDKVGRFFVGPSSAIGFGWVGLSMADFQQTTHTGVVLGNFGLSENAFLAAWSREEIGTWGILRYGVNFKFVTQNFSGLRSSTTFNSNQVSRDWSGGMDIGLTFRPINAPLFNIISIRYLIPFQFGFVLQNLIQPTWNLMDAHVDRFPRVLRWGVSYRMIIKDFVPSSWGAIREFFGRSSILAAYDQEIYQHNDRGHYLGFEGYFPFSQSGLALFPRVGLNNRTEGTSLGLGLTLPFAKEASIRIDYSYNNHPYLPNDNRLFLTVQMGEEKGSGYFKRMSEREGISNHEVRSYLLRILTEYPNDYISEAVEQLALLDDSSNVRRYYELSGGLGRATWLFNEAKDFLKQGERDKAKSRAEKAIEEYRPIFLEPENPLNDQELLDYGESLIMANRMEEAIMILREVGEPSLRSYYLLGISMKALRDWDGAIEMFQNGIKQYETEQDLNSMVCLSFLGLGETLLLKEEYRSAITTLDILLKNYSERLDSNYPRHPIYHDGFVVDEAQFLIGLCQIMLREFSEGVKAIMKTERYYPKLEYGQFVTERSNELIEILITANWNRLDLLAKQYLQRYFQNNG